MAIVEIESRGLTLLSLLLVALASASLGKALNHRAVLFEGKVIWRILLQIAVGYNLLGWIVLIANWIGIQATFGSITLLVALSIPAAASCLFGIASASRKFRFPSRGTSAQCVLFSMLGLLTLGAALCPPETWDELVYHAELPRRWFADGKIGFYFDLPYSGFPSLCEIVSLSVSPIDVTIAPRLISAIAWLLSVAVLFSIARTYADNWIALIITAAFAFSDAVLLVSGGGYVEPVLMMNSVMMLLLFLHAQPHPSTSTSTSTSISVYRLALVIGILAAGCGAVKLTGLVMLPVALLILISICVRLADDRRRTTAYIILAFTVAVSCFLLPFYLRPWLITGNPFFPYFDAWFTSDVNRIESSWFHHAIGSERFGVKGLPALLLSPMLLGFNRDVFDGSLGWQFCLGLAIIVLELVKAARTRTVKPETVVLAFVAIWLFAFWAFTAQQARFAIPAAMVIYVLVTRALAEFSTNNRRLLSAALFVLTLVSAPWGNASFYLGAWMANLGLMNVQALVDEGTGYEYLPLVSAIETATNEDARIMLLLEHRSFYIPRETVIGTPFFQSQAFNPPEDFTTAESVLSVLVEKQISHLVVANQPVGPDFSISRAERLIPLQLGIEAAAARGWLEIVWQSSVYQVLKVNPPTSRN